ncbi:hypothetical protein [Streptomyces sp. NBC_00483]|uniref:hypothetical protein n=1 Tax=Streptomyces sp. NBC_00483 TaxID=2975756 RepID=UPI002E19B766
MTHPASTKSPQTTPTEPHLADTSQVTRSALRPKDDAEGVLSALPFTALTEQEASQVPGPRPIAWLIVRTPYRRTPTARSTCTCGRDLSARGHADVLALIDDHTAHRAACPLRNPQEGRAAA